MASTKFDLFKKSMGEFGFKIDSRIEQKKVANLLGMYANQFIPQGTILSSFPSSMSIPVSTEIEFPEGETGESLKIIHSLARELSNPHSPYKGYFEYCGTIEEIKENSFLFFDQEEYAWLWRMNPIIGKFADRIRTSLNMKLGLLLHLDNTLNHNAAIHALLIYNHRCWGNFGFMPGMDLFNHNTKSDLFPEEAIIDGVTSRVFVTSADIQAGEEIKISYGKKDLAQFALCYDFFDPTDFHLISYSYRVSQTATDDFMKKIVENLKKHYTLKWFQEDGIERFQIEEYNAFFLDHGPNKKMYDLASRLAINNEKDLSRGHADEKTTAKYLLYILKKFREANNVEEYDINTLPSKLHMYHSLLKRELEILDNNIKAIEPKCI